jgi:uracil-DNA glycosylase family 4
VSAVPTDEIYERYLKKAISEINELGDEIARAAGASAPVLGSGHPLADVFMLKYGPQAPEIQEGVAFFGRTGQAILKSLQRLHVDPLAIYGTNCLKYADARPDEQAREWLTRELHIVQPKLVVVMGEDALEFLNSIEFPLSAPLEQTLGELQRFTRMVEALVCPDIDASLDEQPSKTKFWNAFKRLGSWWGEQPPY